MKQQLVRLYILVVVQLFGLIQTQKWDYGANGKDWQDPKCKNNEEGSPVDLVGSFGEAPIQLEIEPNTADVEAMFNWDGNRLYLEGNYASFIITDPSTGKVVTRNFEGQRIDFKQPCEHLLQGDGCDIEMQIFAPETEDSIKKNGESQRPNVAFSFRFKSVNKQTDNFFTIFDLKKKGMMTNFNLFNAFETQSIFKQKNPSKWAYYPGSLTIPFCDDVVQWFVFQPLLEINPAQLDIVEEFITKNPEFSGGDKGNSRAVQELGKRSIKEGDLILDGYKAQSKAKLSAYQCRYEESFPKEPVGNKGPESVFTLYGVDVENDLFIKTKACELKIWELKAKKDKCILGKANGGHKFDITCFDLQDSQIVTGGLDKLLIVWDIETCEAKKTLRGSEEAPTDVALSDDGSKIASCDKDGNVYLWDVATGKFELFEGHEKWCTQVDFDSEGKRLYSTDIEGFVRIWDTEKKGDEALIKTYKAHTGRINALLIIQDRYIVTGGDDKIITVADEDDECETFQFEGHEKEITALQYKAQLEFASSSNDKTIKIWDIKKKEIVKSGDIYKKDKNFWTLVGLNSVACEKEEDDEIHAFRRFKQQTLKKNDKFGSISNISEKLMI